jgi:hypothetical protein
MSEDLIQKIFHQYLLKLDKKPREKSKSASGPDFIVDGHAYECKGSRFDVKLFSQLISYALQYTQVSLVIPYDALSFLLLYRLEALGTFTAKYEGADGSIELFTIVDLGLGKYAIKRWLNARMIDMEISKIFYELMPNYINLEPKGKESKILEFINDIESQIKEGLKQKIIQSTNESKSPYEAALISFNET